jgi:protoporphyrinogen oxidase
MMAKCLVKAGHKRSLEEAEAAVREYSGMNFSGSGFNEWNVDEDIEAANKSSIIAAGRCISA